MDDSRRISRTRPPVSVIVITRNEAHNIAACLRSVAWAEECIVFDSGSADGTVAIAESLGACVRQIDWRGYGPTKQLAAESATHDWILSVDADERVSAELAAEIEQALGANTHVAYEIPRLTQLAGDWIRHSGWYPDYTVRLFRRSHGRFKLARVHERVEVTGSVGRLKNHLLHHSFASFVEYVARQDKYADLAAEELFNQRRSAPLLRLWLSPAVAFVKRYVFKGGCLHGLVGWRLALVSSRTTYRKYAALRKLKRRAARP